MSYIYSGGSEVVNDSAGASSISGYMSGYLIAADTYETETPFARVFRAYGTDVKTENFVVESAGTAYFNNGTQTNLSVGPGGNVGISSSILTGLRVGGYYEGVSGAITSTVANLNKNISCDDVIVYSGAELNVSSGTLTNVTISGNTNKWYAEWAMAKLNVRSNGKIDGGSAVSACRIMVSKGGVVENMVFHTSTHIYALGGGLVSGGTVYCANLEIRSNGTVRGTLVHSGGQLNFTRSEGAAKGLAIDVTIGAKGLARINSGGIMSRTLVSGGEAGAAVVHVSSGAAVSTTLLSKGSMYVSKLAWYTPTVTTTVLSSGAWMAVYGSASDTVVNVGARVDVYSSGVASGAVVNSGGKLCMQSGGSANEVTVNENGWLFLHSGAATNVKENGGWAWGSAGRTTLTFVSNAFSDVTVYSSASVHEVTTATNIRISSDGDQIGSCYVFGGIVHDVEVTGGYLLVNNSGHVSGAIVHSGGTFTVRGGADKSFVSGAMVERGGSMTMNNGSVQNVTISGATVADDADKTLSDFANMYMYNGTLDGLTVKGIAGCYGTNAHADVTKRIVAVISGGTVNGATIEDAGYIHVSGATVNDVTMSKGSVKAWCWVNNVSSAMNTRLQVYKNGVASNVKTLGGTCECFVSNGGKVYDIDLAPGAYFGVYANGLIQGGSAVGKGADMQGRGGMISAVTLMSSGAMFVSTGTVKGNNFISGGYLRVGSKGANAVADSTFISGGYGAKIISSGKEKYTSGVCTAFVSSGGKLTNSLIGEGAWVIVRDSGTVSNTALLGPNTYDANTQDAMMMARIAVSGGAVWRGGDVLKHVQAIVYSGGSAEGITLASGAHFYVSGDATATGMVADGTLDFVVRGGTAENTVIKKGSMTVVSSNGFAGSATGTVVRGGVFRVGNATTATDTVVSNGGTISCTGTGGTCENTTVSSGGYLYGVFGTFNGVTVSSGGSMRVYGSGGTVVSDLTVEAGAKLTLDVGSLPNGGSLNIDSLANVNDTVTVLNYSTDRTYTLAETGNENLEVSINYQGFYYGLGAGESYLSPIYGGRAFTLDAEGKTLSVATNNMSGTILTTEAADLATSGAFLTGFVNSADKAIMWADVNLSSAVTFATSAANIAGDAWIDLDRTKAAGGTIYGAEGDCMGNATIRYLVHGAGSVGNFAGGATAGGVVGGVELVGYNNTYDQTYLGGMGTVAGLVSARVSSGNTLAKDFYAGALANYAKTGTVTSVGGIDTTIALNMSAGTTKETKYYAKGNIYGASQVKAGTVTTAATVHKVGDVVLTISNGETTKDTMCIFAAGYATGHDEAKELPVYTVDSVTATIAGGNWGGAHGGRGVFGGAFAGDNTTAGDAGVWAKVGDVNLTISGGTMGNVYGGGWAQKGAKSEVGNVNLTIKGGTIANVFGGGSHSSSGGSTVTGNITITVSAGTITGDIYARGQLDGDATGSANVIFTGGKNFSCGVYGYSYVSGATGSEDDVTLSFSSYGGTFSGAVGGFNGIALDGNTTMTIGAAADIANTAWTFDTAERYTALAKTAMLDWSAADFTGDTIAINLATGNATEWDLVSAASTTVYNKFDVLVDGASILTETIDLDQAIVGGAYAGWGFTVEEDTLKFKYLA